MKTNKYFYFGCLISVVFLFRSCASTDVAESKDVLQSQIYQYYDINYDEETTDYYSEAVFRFGGSTGTTLHLSDSSNVTVNGLPMQGEKLILRGYVYSLKFEKSIKKLEFIFTDNKNKKFVNSIIIEPIIKINIPDSFSKSKGYEIAWTGEPLRKNEILIVQINGNSNTSANIKSDVIGSNSVTITPDDIKSIASGIANIRLIRQSNNKLKEAAEIGGNIQLTCSSVKYTTKILP